MRRCCAYVDGMTAVGVPEWRMGSVRAAERMLAAEAACDVSESAAEATRGW